MKKRVSTKATGNAPRETRIAVVSQLSEGMGSAKRCVTIKPQCVEARIMSSPASTSAENIGL